MSRHHHHHKGKKCSKHNYCLPHQHEQCMPYNMKQDSCMPKCGCPEPKHKCKKKCVGTYVTKYKVYETCHQEIYKVCSGCRHEYNCHQHNSCPKCGASAAMFVMDSSHGKHHHGKHHGKHHGGCHGGNHHGNPQGCHGGNPPGNPQGCQGGSHNGHQPKWHNRDTDFFSSF